MDRDYVSLSIDQDLGLGMMLWLAHFFPDEPWAETQIPGRWRCSIVCGSIRRAISRRTPQLRQVKFAFTNYGVSLGLQAVQQRLDRVIRLNSFIDTYRSNDGLRSRGDHPCHGMHVTFPGEFLNRRAMS